MEGAELFGRLWLAPNVMQHTCTLLIVFVQHRCIPPHTCVRYSVEHMIVNSVFNGATTSTHGHWKFSFAVEFSREVSHLSQSLPQLIHHKVLHTSSALPVLSVCGTVHAVVVQCCSVVAGKRVDITVYVDCVAALVGCSVSLAVRWTVTYQKCPFVV